MLLSGVLLLVPDPPMRPVASAGSPGWEGRAGGAEGSGTARVPGAAAVLPVLGPPDESGTGEMPLWPELPPAGVSGAAGATDRRSAGPACGGGSMAAGVEPPRV